MGKEKEREQKITLVDFLYKDLNLINSLYSQIFQGTLNSITKTEMSSDVITNEANLSAGFIGGKLTSNETVNETITSNINPLDSLILDLIEALDIESVKDSLINLKTGSIQAVNGTLMIRDYKVINDLLPVMSESNMIPGFSDPVNPNAKGKDRNFTIGKMIQKLISIMPFGLEFEVITNNNEHIAAIVKEEYLTIKPNELLRAYGLTLPSEWVVVGILDKVQPSNYASKSQFKSGIDEMTKLYYSSINDGNSEYIIRPIVIYRKI